MKKFLFMLVILAATAPLGATLACTDIAGTCTTAIRVTNDSVNNFTHEIVIDGLRRGAITPGSSDTYEVNAGTHLVEINVAGGGVACTPSFPTVEECQTFGISCRG